MIDKLNISIAVCLLIIAGGIIGITLSKGTSGNVVIDEMGNISVIETSKLDKINEEFNHSVDDLRDTIAKMARNVSDSHEYILGLFDCTQFSKTLKGKLNEKGIDAYCVAGYMWKYNEEGKKLRKSLHTWVEVNNSGEIIPIEATGGFIIDNATYSSEYFIIRRRLCW